MLLIEIFVDGLHCHAKGGKGGEYVIQRIFNSNFNIPALAKLVTDV